MERGLFIIISVFLLIIVIHLISLKLIRTSEKKEMFESDFLLYLRCSLCNYRSNAIRT